MFNEHLFTNMGIWIVDVLVTLTKYMAYMMQRKKILIQGEKSSPLHKWTRCIILLDTWIWIHVSQLNKPCDKLCLTSYLTRRYRLVAVTCGCVNSLIGVSQFYSCVEPNWYDIQSFHLLIKHPNTNRRNNTVENSLVIFRYISSDVT